MKWIKSNWAIFTLALLVGLIYVSHNFFIAAILRDQGKIFHPITISSNRDEGLFYAPRANAVIGGQLKAGDITVKGNEKSPSMLPLANPGLIGGLGKLFGSLEKGFIFSDFFFPFLIFLALYYLGKEISGSRMFGTVFATVFIFLPKLFLNIPPISLSLFKASLEPILGSRNDQLYFSRFEYPKLTFLFFSLAFLFLYRTIKNKNKYSFFFTGILFGAMFYTYLYDWVYFTITLGILGIFYFAKKNFKIFKKLLLIFAIGLVASIFYWVNFINLQSFPHYNDLFSRIGVEIGNNFRFETAWKTYVRVIGLAFLIRLLFWKEDRTKSIYLISILSTIIIALNIQVILGFNPQPDHWHKIQFLIIGLTIALIIFRFCKKYFSCIPKKTSLIASIVLISIVLVGAFKSQKSFSIAHFNRYTIDNNYEEIYKWLNKNTPNNSVIGSLFRINDETLLFTHNKLFLANGFLTTISNQEIWNRFLEINAIYKVTVDKFRELLQDSNILLYLFHDEYRNRSFNAYFRASQRELPDSVLNQKVEEYKKLIKSPQISFELDYLIFSKQEKEIGQDPIMQIPRLKKVYEQGDIKIYQL